MLRHLLSEIGERLGGAILRLGALVYIRTTTDSIRIVISIQELDDDDTEDDESPASGVDPVYIEWLNQIYRGDSASGP